MNIPDSENQKMSSELYETTTVSRDVLGNILREGFMHLPDNIVPLFPDGTDEACKVMLLRHSSNEILNKTIAALPAVIGPDFLKAFASGLRGDQCPDISHGRTENSITESEFFSHVASIFDEYLEKLQRMDPTKLELGRMLTRLKPSGEKVDENARQGWKIVYDEGQKLGRNIKLDASSIQSYCILASRGPTTKTELKKRSQRTMWKTKVKEKISDLIDLIHGSGVDKKTSFMILEMNRCYSLSEEDPSGFGSKFFEEPVGKLLSRDDGGTEAFFTLSEFLSYISEKVDSTLDECEPFASTKPGNNTKAPKRAYFVRNLNRCLERLYGTDFPIKDVLINFTCAAFEDSTFGKMQLERGIKK